MISIPSVGVDVIGWHDVVVYDQAESFVVVGVVALETLGVDVAV